MSKTDIILKVPKGAECSGCMFLNIDYLNDTAERKGAYCRLFDKRLSARREYGEIVGTDNIPKYHRCPTE